MKFNGIGNLIFTLHQPELNYVQRLKENVTFSLVCSSQKRPLNPHKSLTFLFCLISVNGHV